MISAGNVRSISFALLPTFLPPACKAESGGEKESERDICRGFEAKSLQTLVSGEGSQIQVCDWHYHLQEAEKILSSDEPKVLTPFHETIKKYERLLREIPRVSDAIEWGRTAEYIPLGEESKAEWNNEAYVSDGRKFSDWEIQEKALLFLYLYYLERGYKFPLPRAQVNYTTEEAKRIFVSHVAHTLWVEANKKVPWSLEDYSLRELRSLLNSFYFMRLRQVRNSGNKEIDERWLFFTGSPRPSDFVSIDPQGHYTLARNYLEVSQRGTLFAMSDWMRQLEHASGDSSLKIRLEGRTLKELQEDPVTVGCGMSAALFISLMRSLNIPGESLIMGLPVEDRNGNVKYHPHAGAYFPGARLFLLHGDDFYSKSSSNTPWDKIFVDADYPEVQITPDLEPYPDQFPQNEVDFFRVDRYDLFQRIVYNFLEYEQKFLEEILCSGNYSRYQSLIQYMPEEIVRMFQGYLDTMKNSIECK